MKKFLIAGSSLAAVAAAGSAGAVDVTLGGSIDMGIDFGLGKDNGNLVLGSAYNEISLSLSAAGTTDGGLMFGGSFTLGTATEIEFNPYGSGATKYLAQKTNNDRTDILGHAYNVSGGGKVDVSDVVSVKINSNWIGIDSEASKYIIEMGSSFTSSAICKIAGRGGIAVSAVWAGNTSKLGDDGDWNAVGAGSYLPAGQLLDTISEAVANNTVPNAANGTAGANAAGTGANAGSVNTTHGASAQITQNATVKAGIHTIAKSNPNDVVYGWQGKGEVDFNGVTATGDADVTSAAIYVGPFMEVMMASSSTKMVVGALCLDGNEESGTAFYMDNASDLVTISDASIYIEGGFGRLTLQNGDYAGGVSAIAGAGDQADIDADGLVVIATGMGLMGANPYLAMDLAAGNALSDIEVITGGTMDLGGVSAAFDMALNNGDDLLSITNWDLGLSYAMGDMSLAAAIDSSNDWGLSASMAVAGFGVNAVFGSSSAGDHEKSGITYSVSATTSLNGFGLAIGFDQDLQPAIGIDYDLGGLSLYAGYDAADEGGSVGATLSF
jgi:uncharacterized protein YaiE (UPF0345 family)